MGSDWSCVSFFVLEKEFNANICRGDSPLPVNGVDIVTFKVWRNTLIAHIRQDMNHHYFMDGGLYSEWQAAEFGRRISQLDDDDPDKLALDEKYERIGQQVYNVKINNVLTLRNAQLSKFVTHIATLCHHTENDDVTNYSTSLQWIFDYLKKHYGLETRGANFMNLSDRDGTTVHGHYVDVLFFAPHFLFVSG